MVKKRKSGGAKYNVRRTKITIFPTAKYTLFILPSALVSNNIQYRSYLIPNNAQ